MEFPSFTSFSYSIKKPPCSEWLSPISEMAGGWFVSGQLLTLLAKLSSQVPNLAITLAQAVVYSGNQMNFSVASTEAIKKKASSVSASVEAEIFFFHCLHCVSTMHKYTIKTILENCFPLGVPPGASKRGISYDGTFSSNITFTGFKFYHLSSPLPPASEWLWSYSVVKVL